MRADYGLYVVALICFIIAGVFLADVTGIGQTMSLIATAVFVILGILFAAGGYTFRPKVVAKAPEAPPPTIIEPSPPVTPPPPSPTEEQVTYVPPTPPPEEVVTAPAPAMEEPAKVEEEKPVRRRRRKKTA